MELLVLIHGVLQEGHLVLQVGLLQEPLVVVPHQFVLLAVLHQQLLDPLTVTVVRLLQHLHLLALLLKLRL